MSGPEVIQVHPLPPSVAAILLRPKAPRATQGGALATQLLLNGVWKSRGPGVEPAEVAQPCGPVCPTEPEAMELYVALAEGVFGLDPARRSLVPIISEDIRTFASGPGERGRRSDPRIQTIVVVHVAKAEDPDDGSTDHSVEAATTAADVYLFAAARGHACWIHDCDKTTLAHKLNLPEAKRVLFAQTIEYTNRREAAA